MTDKTDRTGTENQPAGAADHAVEKAKLKAIEEQVQARAADKEQAYPDVSLNNGRIDSRFIDQYMQTSELGLGVFYTQVNKDCFIHNVTTAKWMLYNGVHWVDDDHNQHLYACEKIVIRLLEEAEKINEQIGWAAKKKDKSRQNQLTTKRELIMKRIAVLRTDRGRNATVKFAISCKEPLTVKSDDFDNDPWLLGCANGVIDLRSCKFIPGEPTQFINKAARAEWKGMYEPSPTWDRYIMEVMADDPKVYYYMQRLLGYSVSGLTREHIMPVLWGKGRNGKGRRIRTLKRSLRPRPPGYWLGWSAGLCIIARKA